MLFGMTTDEKLKNLKKWIPIAVSEMMIDESLIGSNAYNGIAKFSWIVTQKIEDLIDNE